ncbi:MAG: tryptophan-rich sensory protein, partial [Candidatus Aminicenantes bacterium]|nr:tryptophan-rich sensory protein [Candidatus Aminicenantes bacterium]
MKTRDLFYLIGSVLLCQLAGIVGGIFTASSVGTWYAGLTKPAFNPPSWVFSPVWITLYLLMGIALFLVLKKDFDSEGVRIAVIFFVCQLVLNALWSYLFFGLKAPLAAFLEIVVLWALILITTVKFFRISRAAGILLVPYLLWVGFASVL